MEDGTIAPLAVTERILVVEDDTDPRRMIAHLLRASGYDVDVLEDGRDLVSQAVLWRVRRMPSPRVVVMDVRMPHTSGIDAPFEIRRCGIRLPAVLVSAHWNRITKSLARQAGAAACLSKPFDPSALVLAVGTALLSTRIF